MNQTEPKAANLAVISLLSFLPAALTAVALFTGATANAQGPLMSSELLEATTQAFEDTFTQAGIPKAHKLRLKVIPEWHSIRNGVYVQDRRKPGTFVVPGGFARNFDGVTGPDVVSLVLCMRIGERLAGHPPSRVNTVVIYTNEMNASYYASYACTTLLWQDQKEENAKSRERIEEKPKAFCDAAYPDQTDKQNLCYRKMLAAQVLMTYVNRDKPLPVDKPSTIVVEKTRNNRPRPQCWLDTLMAGMACKAYANWDHYSAPQTEAEMAKVSCAGKYPEDPVKTVALGYRPRCWFAPSGQGAQ